METSHILVHTVSKNNSKRCLHSCVRRKPVKVRNCRECKVVIYCVLITTRNAKSRSVTSKTRNAYLDKNALLFAVNRTSNILLVRCGICIVMLVCWKTYKFVFQQTQKPYRYIYSRELAVCLTS